MDEELLRQCPEAEYVSNLVLDRCGLSMMCIIFPEGLRSRVLFFCGRALPFYHGRVHEEPAN